jgi:hypothetical protein
MELLHRLSREGVSLADAATALHIHENGIRKMLRACLGTGCWPIKEGEKK